MAADRRFAQHRAFGSVQQDLVVPAASEDNDCPRCLILTRVDFAAARPNLSSDWRLAGPNRDDDRRVS